MKKLVTLLSVSALISGCTHGAQDWRKPPSAADHAIPFADVADKADVGSFGFDVAGMDRTVEPGADFYAFANGTWARNTPIPADRSVYGTMQVVYDRTAERVRTILHEEAGKPGSKVGDFFASFIERPTVEALGAKPIAPLLQSIERVSTKAELASVIGRLNRMGVSVPVRTHIWADAKESDTVIVHFVQGGLGLPGRDHYLNPAPASLAKRDLYRAYLVQLLQLRGEADAAARAGRVVAFETKLAEAHWSPEQNRQADRTYNKWSSDQLAAAAPGIDWLGLRSALGLTTQDKFIISQPSAMTATASLLASTPLETVKDYLSLRALDTFAPFLSSAFVDAQFSFAETGMKGTPENFPVERRGVKLLTAKLGDEVGRIYAERYFPPKVKAEAERLVATTISAMDRRLQSLSWMTPETKRRARAKLARTTVMIGYPDSWRDHSSLEIRRSDLLGNVMRSNEFNYRQQLAKLGRPVNRREWQLPPMTVDAYAIPSWNQIVFPAGIFQAPLFDPKADPAINYGAIGAIIGHEITHLFDDQGAKFDENGELRNWWSEEDKARFSLLTAKLVDQYSRYEVLPGEFVNGKLTLGENIGDVAGLTVAHEAYRSSLGGRAAPVLDGFTGDQRFFLAWAQTWRRNTREGALAQQLLTDPHSPWPQRAATVRNLDLWYTAFGVEPDDPLYLPPDQRVRIW